MSRLELELAELKQMLITMGGLADDAVRRAISAIFNRDASVANTAKETDKEIDGLQLDIDEKAIELLRSASSPKELRFITVAMKIARDLERVGDEATTIIRFRRARRGGAESERAFPQGIEHPQFLRNGPCGQIAAQGALAGEDLFQVEAHDVRNCRSNCCQRSTRACRASMA